MQSHQERRKVDLYRARWKRVILIHGKKIARNIKNLKNNETNTSKWKQIWQQQKWFKTITVRISTSMITNQLSEKSNSELNHYQQ